MAPATPARLAMAPPRCIHCRRARASEAFWNKPHGTFLEETSKPRNRRQPRESHAGPFGNLSRAPGMSRPERAGPGERGRSVASSGIARGALPRPRASTPVAIDDDAPIKRRRIAEEAAWRSRRSVAMASPLDRGRVIGSVSACDLLAACVLSFGNAQGQPKGHSLSSLCPPTYNFPALSEVGAIIPEIFLRPPTSASSASLSSAIATLLGLHRYTSCTA